MTADEQFYGQTGGGCHRRHQPHHHPESSSEDAQQNQQQQGRGRGGGRGRGRGGEVGGGVGRGLEQRVGRGELSRRYVQQNRRGRQLSQQPQQQSQQQPQHQQQQQQSHNDHIEQAAAMFHVTDSTPGRHLVQAPPPLADNPLLNLTTPSQPSLTSRHHYPQVPYTQQPPLSTTNTTITATVPVAAAISNTKTNAETSTMTATLQHRHYQQQQHYQQVSLAQPPAQPPRSTTMSATSNRTNADHQERRGKRGSQDGSTGARSVRSAVDEARLRAQREAELFALSRRESSKRGTPGATGTVSTQSTASGGATQRFLTTSNKAAGNIQSSNNNNNRGQAVMATGAAGQESVLKRPRNTSPDALLYAPTATSLEMMMLTSAANDAIRQNAPRNDNNNNNESNERFHLRSEQNEDMLQRMGMDVDIEVTRGKDTVKSDEKEAQPQEKQVVEEEKEKQQRYQHRLDMNRESAAVSRVRRRAYVKELEEQLAVVEAEKLQLEGKLDLMQAQNSSIRKQLDDLCFIIASGKHPATPWHSNNTVDTRIQSQQEEQPPQYRQQRDVAVSSALTDMRSGGNAQYGNLQQQQQGYNAEGQRGRGQAEGRARGRGGRGRGRGRDGGRLVHSSGMNVQFNTQGGDIAGHPQIQEQEHGVVVGRDTFASEESMRGDIRGPDVQGWNAMAAIQRQVRNDEEDENKEQVGFAASRLDEMLPPAVAHHLSSSSHMLLPASHHTVPNIPSHRGAPIPASRPLHHHHHHQHRQHHGVPPHHGMLTNTTTTTTTARANTTNHNNQIPLHHGDNATRTTANMNRSTNDNAITADHSDDEHVNIHHSR